MSLIPALGYCRAVIRASTIQAMASCAALVLLPAGLVACFSFETSEGLACSETGSCPADSILVKDLAPDTLRYVWGLSFRPALDIVADASSIPVPSRNRLLGSDAYDQPTASGCAES